MDSARWEQIQAIFHEAAGLSEAEREAYLQKACGHDAAIIGEVLTMLEADRASASLLDRGLPDIAFRMLGESTEPVSPQNFGPYRFIRILGEGGMGVVWLAERADAGNLVAIKFLLHAGLSPARRERFAREIKTLAKLKHPFIARLYDAGTLDNGTPWFVMEYVDGVRFNDYCRRPEQTIEEKLRLFRSVCEAVQYAHGQEIIHRDLKPSNILVEENGTPRLLDFGIARELQSLDEPADQTRPGLRFRSPHYAAPEWVREGTVGFYTDVYSLGVMLYEMLAGQLPFAESTTPTDEAARDPVERVPEKPSVVAARQSGGQSKGTLPQLSKASWSEMDVLCLKAMHQDAHQRYQSVEALMRDLDHYLKQEPLEARPDSSRYRLSKFLKRNRRPVFATAAVLTLVAGLVIFFTLRLARARNAELAAAVRTQRIQRFMLNLLGDSDREAAPSGELRVVSLLNRGAKDADSLSSDPETQIELYESLGTMYNKLGKFQKADQLLSAALAKAKATLGPDNPKVAELLVEIGGLRGDQSQPQAAVQLVTEGVDLASHKLPTGDPELLQDKVALGRVLVQAGEYEKGIAILQPIAQRQPRGEQEAYAVRDSLATLEVAEFYAQHYDIAESDGRKAIAMDRQLLGASHPQTGFDLMNLASIQLSELRYSEAEKNYRDGIAILKDWYGADHPDVATSMGILARVLVAEGKDAEAEPVLEQVLKIQELNYGKVHERIAFTLDALGKIAVKRGDLTAAEADFSRAFEIDRSLLGDKNYQTAVIEADLGDVYMRQSRYDLAESTLRDSVHALEALPPGNQFIGMAQARLGRVLFRTKRYNEAEQEFLAAYESMGKQRKPSSTLLHDLRQDLAAVYIALNEPEKAKKFEAELATAESLTAGVASSK